MERKTTSTEIGSLYYLTKAFVLSTALVTIITNTILDTDLQ